MGVQTRPLSIKVLNQPGGWMKRGLTTILLLKKCWSHAQIDAFLTDICSTNTLIILYAASSEGFLNGTKLFFKTSATGDCHGQMNSINFEKWTTDGQRSYHRNRNPIKSCTKAVLLDWLTKTMWCGCNQRNKWRKKRNFT